ncbi:hypothetical protein ACHAPQ_011251 [Fusarium lateritium]
MGKDSNDNIVFPDLAQCVVVGIVSGHKLGFFMLFVEKELRSKVLGCNGADPADRVLLGIRHDRRSMTSEEEDVILGALDEAQSKVRMLLMAAGMYQALRMCEDPGSQPHRAYVQLAAG